MENWPVLDDATCEELMQLQDTHWIMPIPTYSTNEALIMPAIYRRSLENALIAVCFNLSHWEIQGKNVNVGNDVFTHIVSPCDVLPVQVAMTRDVKLACTSTWPRLLARRFGLDEQWDFFGSKNSGRMRKNEQCHWLGHGL